MLDRQVVSTVKRKIICLSDKLYDQQWKSKSCVARPCAHVIREAHNDGQNLPRNSALFVQLRFM